MDVLSISVSPSFASDKTVFAGLMHGGVYRSTDGGTLWVPSNIGIETQKIETIETSPFFSSDGTVFAGTTSSGVFRSTDGGLSWASVNAGLPFLSIAAIGISPNYAIDRTVLVGTHVGGIYRSTDAGASWASANAGLVPNLLRVIAFSPDFGIDKTVYAGTYKGVYRSTDGGGAWTRVQRLNRFEEHSHSLNYSGSWKTLANADSSGGVVNYSGVAGNTVSFDFTGNRVRWMATNGPNQGKAEVYVDGVFTRTVDMYSATRKFLLAVFDTGGLPPGQHSIMVRVSGSKNQASSGSFVTLDAFEVED